jgi:flagellar biogenesis protein FliO
MKKHMSDESGFITMMLSIIAVIAFVVYLVYMRVAGMGQ